MAANEPGMSPPVSVVILTREEADALPDCLASLAGFADLHVLDTPGRDETAGIARRAGARVTRFHWNGRYPKKKQWALDHLPLAHRWVLLLDADERLTPALHAEIADLFRAGAPLQAGFFIRCRNRFAGVTLAHGRATTKIVLIDRSRARFAPADDLGAPGSWEVEGHYQPSLDGPAGRLKAAGLHDLGIRGPRAWCDRHERYAAWEGWLRATGRLDRRREPGLRGLAKALFHALPRRDIAAFLDSYLICGGWRDGAAGLAFARARAAHYRRVAVWTRIFRADPDAAGDTVPASFAAE